MDINTLMKILSGVQATSKEMEEAAVYLSADGASDPLKAAFLSSTAMRDLTFEEISGFARGLRSQANMEKINGCSDIVGTGGDMKGTINVSTAASIVCSSLGIRIAKHGNRGITGKSGGADFMEQCGYAFPKNQEIVERDIYSFDFAFILASAVNQSFSKFSPVRKKLGFKTIFNVMGPITNPISPERVVIGCTDVMTQDIFLKILKFEGKQGIVVRGEDGMDEISFNGKSSLKETLSNREKYIDFREVTGSKIEEDSVTGKSLKEVFCKTMDGISGKNVEASKFIALNAAPCILLNGLSSSLERGYEMALKAISSGNAVEKLSEITGGRVMEVMQSVR